jgi:hypothetical protein
MAAVSSVTPVADLRRGLLSVDPQILDHFDTQESFGAVEVVKDLCLAATPMKLQTFAARARQLLLPNPATLVRQQAVQDLRQLQACLRDSRKRRESDRDSVRSSAAAKVREPVTYHHHHNPPAPPWPRP